MDFDPISIRWLSHLPSLAGEDSKIGVGEKIRENFPERWVDPPLGYTPAPLFEQITSKPTYPSLKIEHNFQMTPF